MGWWGFGPMDGDTPLDFEGAINRAAGGVSDFDVMPSISSHDALQRVIAASEGIIQRMGSWDANIFWQALAVMVMRGGGPLSLVRDDVLKAIDADEWSTESMDRQRVMVDFRKHVVNYQDGQIVDLSDKGLFAAILDHVESGESGLVNV